MKTSHKILLATIVIFGFILRIYQVDQLPSILNRDEAALAYNGLLLSKTGKDEWGQKLPLALESFGDYKLPGYPYLLAGLFKLLPTNDFVVRLPSVIAGTWLIVVAYLFARKFKLDQTFSLLFALVVATLPVYIFYSRMAWEANLALALFLTALLLLFDKPSLIKDLAALILLLVSVFTYNSPLLYLPFVLLLLPLSRGLKKYNKWILPVIGQIVILLVSFIFLKNLSEQKSGITIFSDETVWTNYVSYRQNFSGIWQSLIGNRYFYWLKLMGQNLISSFSPHYLLIKGGTHPWHSVPGYAHFYWTLYLLARAGLVYQLVLIIKKILSKDKIELNGLILIAASLASLAPAIITIDAPHATRGLAFFFFFSLLAVKTLADFIEYLSGAAKHLLMLFLLILSLEIGRYFQLYFVNYPQSQQVYKPAFDILIQELEAKFPQKEIAVVDGGGYQYILTAWYLKLTPEKYFQTNIRQLPDQAGLRYGQQVDDYHFIVSKEDRVEAEEILVYWDDQLNQWQVERWE